MFFCQFFPQILFAICDDVSHYHRGWKGQRSRFTNMTNQQPQLCAYCMQQYILSKYLERNTTSCSISSTRRRRGGRDQRRSPTKTATSPATWMMMPRPLLRCRGDTGVFLCACGGLCRGPLCWWHHLCVWQEVDRVSVQLSFSSPQDPGGRRSHGQLRLTGQGSGRVTHGLFNYESTWTNASGLAELSRNLG